MSRLDPELRVHKRVPFEEVYWARGLDILCTRFKLPFQEADTMLKSFLRRFLTFANPYWFIKSELNPIDNRLVVALCDAHGCDEITLLYEKSFFSALLQLTFKQEISFTPSFNERAGSRVAPKMSLSLFGLELRLARLLPVLVANGVLFCMLVLLYVLLTGITIYGISVLILFIQLPEVVTVVATRKGVIGIAFLCFLIGAAGIAGKAIKNVIGLWLGRFKALLKSNRR